MATERLKMTVEIVSLFASSYKLSTNELLEKVKEVFNTSIVLERTVFIPEFILPEKTDEAREVEKIPDSITAAA
jgi:hypothetical protein